MKNVLITGASRGIGRATALLLGERGYFVGVNYMRDRKGAEETVAEITAIGGKAVPLQFDVKNFSEVYAAVKFLAQKHGMLDALVANAGIARFGLFTDTREDDYEEIMSTNLKGVYNCIKAVAPSMLSARNGSIVAIGSVWGETGASCEALYSASKAGVVGLVKAVAKEFALSGVRVNCVSPGFVKTEMNNRLSEYENASFIEQIPMNRAGEPEEIARATAFLLSDEASYITGQVLSVNGGLHI